MGVLFGGRSVISQVLLNSSAFISDSIAFNDSGCPFASSKFRGSICDERDKVYFSYLQDSLLYEMTKSRG